VRPGAGQPTAAPQGASGWAGPAHHPARPQARGDAPGPRLAAEGVLELTAKGHGFLRVASNNYLPAPGDVFVPEELVREWGLLQGVAMKGAAERRPGRVQGPFLVSVEQINYADPEDYRRRRPFSELVSIDPNERLRLETTDADISMRVMDLLTPIGKGQRCLIVAPPKAGKTVLLQKIAHSISTNHPEVVLVVLLIDERPEEVTDMRRNVRGEVVASSMDDLQSNHVSVAEIVLDRARRLVESGRDVLVLLDSITRLARAYNAELRGSGKILSGGLDSRTMEKPRRFFGAARNVEGGGSLTIVATALVDTGSRMDEVIFQEFKGTGNTEILLDRELFDRRVFPCIDVSRSGTRKEEKLYEKEELPRVHLIRRALSGLSPVEAMTTLLSRLEKYPTNSEFLRSLG